MTSLMQSLLIFLETKGTNIVVSIVALIFGILAINNLMKVIKMAVVDSKLEKSMVKLLLTIVKFILYFALILYILTKMGIGLTGIVAAFSAFSLAIGLAVQDVIGGLANGLVIVTTRPFKVGDLVEIGGITGTVKETNLMHTVIDTPDLTHIYIPNKTVYNSLIQNYSTNPQRRLDYEVGVDYATDVIKAKKVFEDFLNNHPLVLKKPAPVVYIGDLADSSINFKLRAWVRNEDYWTYYFDIRAKIVPLCAENGIEFPFPQITLSQREPIAIKQEKQEETK